MIDSQQPLVVTPHITLTSPSLTLKSAITRHPSHHPLGNGPNKCIDAFSVECVPTQECFPRELGQGAKAYVAFWSLIHGSPCFWCRLLTTRRRARRTGCSRGGRSHPSHPSPELYPAHSARQLIDRERPESLTRHPDLNTSDNNDVDDG